MPHHPSLVAAALAAVLLAGCARDAEPAADEAAPPAPAGELVIYSGRSEALVEPLLERFRQETGLTVRARYGKDAELLAALQEEGAASPADLFWANTTGALGAASNAGLLARLPDSLLEKPAAFRPSSGLWAPATVRFRVLAYHPQRVDAASLPASVLDLPQQTALRGRVGWTPTYSSFQDFVTALRLTAGDDRARRWLDGMRALEPKAYPSNTPMLEALAADEIDVALTNHYYVLRMLEGEGSGEENAAQAEAPVALHHFAAGDVGNLALVTGAGLLATSDHRAEALRFLSFLLSPEAQAMAAASVHEYPVMAGTALPAAMGTLDRALALSPALDFERLRDLDATLRLLREAELL